MNTRELKLTQANINGEWHICDKAVLDEIKRLESEIVTLKDSVTKEKSAFRQKIYDMVDLIAFNLNDEINGGMCLKHPIDYYTVTANGEPVYKFRDTVFNKIKNGILGLDSMGARPQMRVKTVFYANEKPTTITVEDALKLVEKKANGK